MTTIFINILQSSFFPSRTAPCCGDEHAGPWRLKCKQFVVRYPEIHRNTQWCHRASHRLQRGHIKRPNLTIQRREASKAKILVKVRVLDTDEWQKERKRKLIIQLNKETKTSEASGSKRPNGWVKTLIQKQPSALEAL